VYLYITPRGTPTVPTPDGELPSILAYNPVGGADTQEELHALR
jgi:hypothetical protein